MKTEQQINDQIDTLVEFEKNAGAGPPPADDMAIAQAAVVEVAKAVLQWVLADEADDPKLSLPKLSLKLKPTS